MKNVKRVLLEKVAKTAYETAKQEADSACLCFAYQPVMPQKVKEMKKKKQAVKGRRYDGQNIKPTDSDEYD